MLPRSVDPLNRGVTVQLLTRCLSMFGPTSVWWVHSLLEKETSNLARYNYQPKPAGWGNAGGGLEPDDIENLVRLLPDHPVLSDNTLSDDEKLIIAGGIREFVNETGYREIEIITDFPGKFLFDYVYRDYVDDKGNVCLGGHRKITLWSELNSVQVHPESWTERHEVDRGEWFDLSKSLTKPFFNRQAFPDRPYWSHVRSTVIGLKRIYGHLRANNFFIEDIRDKIHPSWCYVFPIGIGDSRFPADGYQMSSVEWGGLFDLMVDKRMEIADNDFIAQFLGNKLRRALRQEEESVEVFEEKEEKKESDVSSGDFSTLQFLSSEEIRRMEDEEYARWFEDEADLPDELRLVTRRPVA